MEASERLGGAERELALLEAKRVEQLEQVFRRFIIQLRRIAEQAELVNRPPEIDEAVAKAAPEVPLGGAGGGDPSVLPATF